jgi:hypothetical protein
MTAASDPLAATTFERESHPIMRSRAQGPACRSSDASVSTALMAAVEPEQPVYLSDSDAVAAPVDRFPHRQTLIVSHCPQRLPGAPLSIPDQSLAFTECGQHHDR